MKLLRYGPVGAEKPALLDGDGVIRDLSGVIPDLTAATLAAGALATIAGLDPASLPAVPAGVRIGPCIAGIGNFVAVGLNYAEHATETNAEIPSHPILFNKARSCIVGPNDEVVLPPGSTKADWEVELAFVIGRTAYEIPESEALDYIAGYCVCNDVSERELQLERSGQWVTGKCLPSFGPLGPWLVTPDEVPDVQNLSLWLDVNGERVQSASTSTMIFPVAKLVSFISHCMILEPGDVVTTGTPPGVGLGMKPQRFLKGGDVMELGVEGLGTQRQTVRARSR